MKRTLLTCAVLACAMSLAACATTDPPLTLADKIALAQTGVDVACVAAAALEQSGEIHGQDATNVDAGCIAARDVLAALQASIPPAAAASSPGS